MKFTKEHLPAFKYAMRQLDKQIKTMERYKCGIDFYFESPHVCDMVRGWSEETQDVNHDDAKMIASEIIREITIRIESSFSIVDWLHNHNHIDYDFINNPWWRGNYEKSMKVQQYRRAWVQSMIEECEQ